MRTMQRFGCGGAALMVHCGLRVRNVHRMSGPIDAVFADVFIDGGWVTIGSVYNHPDCSNTDDLERFLFSRDQFLIGGDLNARHTDYGDASSNYIGTLLTQLSNNSGIAVLSPPIPTCFHSVGGSYIDKFLTNPMPRFSYSLIGVLTSFSDHSGISISIHCPTFDLQIRNGFSIKQYNCTNFPKMIRFLQAELGAPDMPTKSNLAVGDLEFLARRIGEILSRATDKYVPTTFVRTSLIQNDRRFAPLPFHTTPTLSRYPRQHTTAIYQRNPG